MIKYEKEFKDNLIRLHLNDGRTLKIKENLLLKKKLQELEK